MSKKRRLHQGNSEQYVVGYRRDGWLLPELASELADAQNLEAAKRFSSLADAIAASSANNCSVFQLVVGDRGSEELKELWVDLKKAEEVPYTGCYWLMPRLLIGPNPLRHDREGTAACLRQLREVQVSCVVSLLSREELYYVKGAENEEWLEKFQHHVFPIRDGGVPTRPTMRLILDVIERPIARGEVTLVHCWGGRGRSGLVAACFVARHGAATGQAALNFVTRRRFEVGLFAPSPETPAQLDFACAWEEGN